MQHASGIANTARIHGHIDDLLLDVRRLAGIGIRQEERAPVTWARAASVALLAFRRGAMPDDIGSLAVRAVEHVGDHHRSLSHRGFCSTQTPIQYSRSTDLKHLRQIHSQAGHYGPCLCGFCVT
jgi:hypothetical protein